MLTPNGLSKNNLLLFEYICREQKKESGQGIYKGFCELCMPTDHFQAYCYPEAKSLVGIFGEREIACESTSVSLELFRICSIPL